MTETITTNSDTVPTITVPTINNTDSNHNVSVIPEHDGEFNLSEKFKIPEEKQELTPTGRVKRKYAPRSKKESLQDSPESVIESEEKESLSPKEKKARDKNSAVAMTLLLSQARDVISGGECPKFTEPEFNTTVDVYANYLATVDFNMPPWAVVLSHSFLMLKPAFESKAHISRMQKIKTKIFSWFV